MELVTSSFNPAQRGDVVFGVYFGDPTPTPLDRAKERFGGPFAHEPKTRWKQNATPVLTRWMAKEPWSNQV